LYASELKDLYGVEMQLLKAPPRMAMAAPSPHLRAAFEEHLEVTRRQVVRLGRIFEGLDASPKGKKCKAMEGLIEEGMEVMQEDAPEEILDATPSINGWYVPGSGQHCFAQLCRLYSDPLFTGVNWSFVPLPAQYGCGAARRRLDSYSSPTLFDLSRKPRQPALVQ